MAIFANAITIHITNLHSTTSRPKAHPMHWSCMLSEHRSDLQKAMIQTRCHAVDATECSKAEEEAVDEIRRAISFKAKPLEGGVRGIKCQ